MIISRSKKDDFFEVFMKKVIDMYYGENVIFLKNDVYGLRRMVFLRLLWKKLSTRIWSKSRIF